MSRPPGHPDLLRLRLVRASLDALLAPRLPPGLEVRPFRDGDEPLWVAVVREADTLQEVTRATFDRSFAAHAGELPRRLLMVVAARGEAVGTVAAWFGEDGWGRVHWLAVRPAWQGQGVGRALLLLALHRLRELGHARAFLITEAGRGRALRLYRSAGFEPDIRDERERRVWRRIEDTSPPGAAASRPEPV